MSTKDFDDRVLGEATGVGAPPPPPSPNLLRAVGTMEPVRTRGRYTLLAAFAGLVTVGPLFAFIGGFIGGHLRRDLRALPIVWLVAATALWALTAALSMAAALVPSRGAVLPTPSRASRVSAVAMAAVALFVLFATVDVPGLSMLPAERGWTMLHSCLHCLGLIMLVATPAVIAAATVSRRLFPVGGARIGMALGAAGGAAGGLLLVFICPFASTTHVFFRHVGGLVLAALAGALLVPAIGRMRHLG